MIMKGRLKFLKLLSDFRSKNYELKYVRETLKDAHMEFELYHREWCIKNNVDLEKLNQENQRKVDMTFIENQTTKLKRQVIKDEVAEKRRNFKGLYKQIARKLHPDKLGDDDPRKMEYEDAFKKATRANASGRWGELFDVVDKYNIFLGEYEDAIECLKTDIKRLEEELKKEKSSYSWLLYEAETEQQKGQVVKNFLRQLFGWKG